VTRRRTRTLAALGALALAIPAGAAPVAPLAVALAVKDGRLLASVHIESAFAPADQRELGNGLTNVVAVYVTVAPAAGGPPALVFGRVIDILFDVWDEVYVVTVKDPRVPQGVRLVLRDGVELRAFLSEQRDLDLGPSALLPAGAFVIEARVELNPVSKEQLRRTREFISNPAAGTRAGGSGSRSVLGAMASFLLRDPEPGSAVHLFRSRALSPAEVVPR
jgi:hypothetical protein